MNYAKLRKRYGHLIGLSLVSEKVSKVRAIVDAAAIERRLAAGGENAHEVTVVAIAREEAPYFLEWIEFHRLVGVTHFVIYDNDSHDNTAGILKPYIDAGIVTMVPWPSFLAGANAQHLAYAHAAVFLTGRSRWFVTLDLDEFLFPVEGDDLRSIMRDYDDLPAVGIFLRCFGPGGHETTPVDLVIKSYLKRLDDNEWENRQYKSAAHPEYISSIISAQRFHNTKDQVPAYDEARNPLVSSTGHDHVSARLRINHYATRSMEELREKVNRRYFWSEQRDDTRRDEKMRQHAKLFDCQIEDTDILRFAPELEARLDAVRRGKID